MELKERLVKILKAKYGIETEEDLKKALEDMPALDFGIFVHSWEEGIKSA